MEHIIKLPFSQAKIPNTELNLINLINSSYKHQIDLKIYLIMIKERKVAS